MREFAFLGVLLMIFNSRLVGGFVVSRARRELLYAVLLPIHDEHITGMESRVGIGRAGI